MHKSIFKKVEDYKSNPLEEFIKLDSFYRDSNKDAYFYFGSGSNVYSLLAHSFVFCEKLTGVYKDFDDCLDSELGYLRNRAYDVDWQYLSKEDKDRVLDEFQTFA